MKKYPSDTLFINRIIQKLKVSSNKLGEKKYWIISFLAGAALEFCMVKLEVNGHSYYKTYTKREALKEAQKRYIEELGQKRVAELLKTTPKEDLESVI